jgi:phosphoadenosine phosphosulfate reductase
VNSSEDIKIKFSNCTTENNAIVYQLNKPIEDEFYKMFIPFGDVSKELGRKLIREVIILDSKSKIPVISIQPFDNNYGYDNAVKIKTMNVDNHEDLQKMISFQIRKYNACRKCLKCESLCKYGAISIVGDKYIINEDKCRRCKMCVKSKYLEGGCLMSKYLYVK